MQRAIFGVAPLSVKRHDYAKMQRKCLDPNLLSKNPCLFDIFNSFDISNIFNIADQNERIIKFRRTGYHGALLLASQWRSSTPIHIWTTIPINIDICNKKAQWRNGREHWGSMQNESCWRVRKTVGSIRAALRRPSVGPFGPRRAPKRGLDTWNRR